MKIEEILDWLGGQGYVYIFRGDSKAEIRGFSSLNNYKEGTLTWIKEEKSYNSAGRLKGISCAVVESGVNVDFLNAIFTGNSKKVFFEILHNFWGEKGHEGSVGEGTFVSGNVEIAPTASIGYNCSIVGNVLIGEHSVIEHNVVIQGNVKIGKNCYIQSGTVIGIDGFGYSINPDTGKKQMVDHFGGVNIGNNVFIGSHVNIARGTIDDTVIGNGVKIAPSTHIGHNSMIEDNVTIICSAIYGSCKIGRGSYITASTIQDQTKIGKCAVVGMGSVVNKSIEDNVVAYGVPAKVIKPNYEGM